MTFTRQIPVGQLAELDVHEGDTLRIVGRSEASFVVQVIRPETVGTAVGGKASDWLRSARGSVRLRDGETVGDARIEFLQWKYEAGR